MGFENGMLIHDAMYALGLLDIYGFLILPLHLAGIATAVFKFKTWSGAPLILALNLLPLAPFVWLRLPFLQRFDVRVGEESELVSLVSLVMFFVGPVLTAGWLLLRAFGKRAVSLENA